LGTIDVSFYRDDYKSRGLHARVKRSDIPFEVADADAILATTSSTPAVPRAAINELFDYGRPQEFALRHWSTVGPRTPDCAPVPRRRDQGRRPRTE
jgi:pyrimidine operon attenuation protein/uracil phosphoribosyltransferase